MPAPEFGDRETYDEYRQRIHDQLDTQDEGWCEQCERVPSLTCPACGDQDELHAA